MPYRTLEEIYAEKITVVSNPQVTLTLTADDWELYNDDTGRYAARENVAVALNERIANAINTSQTVARHIGGAFRFLSGIATWGPLTLRAVMCWGRSSSLPTG
jgi:hypothetical protein